jgi:protein O-GlcNAc transferase
MVANKPRSHSMKKPDLRIIHNMARSGGTLISRCLGCMQNVVLLSEMHPFGVNLFDLNPFLQANKWFGLLTPSDIAMLQLKGAIKYKDAIALIEQRTRDQGDLLVLRDWAHLDYTANSFRTPGYRPMLYLKLADHFNIIRLSISRDPVTQWLSLIRLPIIQKSLESRAFDLDQFLFGYRKYAELCMETGFIRYEDFLLEPEKKMRELCDHLHINFDPNFISNWHGYKTISGDVIGKTTSGDIISSRGGNEIKPLPMRPIEPSLKEQFLANVDYHRAIELLGYEQIS